MDKQRLLDFIRAEIKKANEYIDITDLMTDGREKSESLTFYRGAELALIRLLSAIEHGKFDEEAQHDA
jgi:hypothetical protein